MRALSGWLSLSCSLPRSSVEKMPPKAPTGTETRNIWWRPRAAGCGCPVVGMSALPLRSAHSSASNQPSGRGGCSGRGVLAGLQRMLRNMGGSGWVGTCPSSSDQGPEALVPPTPAQRRSPFFLPFCFSTSISPASPRTVSVHLYIARNPGPLPEPAVLGCPDSLRSPSVFTAG